MLSVPFQNVPCTFAARIGGPSANVEVDEAKFGKRKYNRGQLVDGTLVIGGIQRNTDLCFLTCCPDNRRDEATLLPIIQQKNLGDADAGSYRVHVPEAEGFDPN